MVRFLFGLFLAAALFGAGHAALAADSTDPRLSERSIGDPKAPVRIDEYFSLDCPHCAEFDTERLPKLKADYIDKGQLKFVFHDFPLHEISLRAAMLTRCIAPDRYLALVETLFRTQLGWAGQPSEQGQMAALKQQAKFAGMSDAQIDSCLNDRALEDAMLKQRLSAGNDMKINATPTIIINGDVKNGISGVPTYDVLKAKIDVALKK